MSTAIGRSVVGYKLNNSGGGVIKGDVVVPDTTANNAFTTTTSAASTAGVWVADETIPSAATGRVVLEGHVSLVNVSASVTRGHTGTTHTVAKQAVSTGGTTRSAGTFCKFTTGGTTPEADIWPVDLLGTSLTNPMNTTGDIIVGGASGAPARLAIGAAGTVLKGGTTPAYGQATALILDYTQSADINGISIGLSTFTDVLANQNFTTVYAGSLVEIIVRGVAVADGAVGIPVWLVRAVIDSAGTPINVPLSGTNLTAATPVNPHAATAPVYLSGLAVGVHTIKLQSYCTNGSGTPKYYCRPTSQTPNEYLFIQIIEHL